MIKSNYLVHDCETGGLDCNKNPITQYACVVLDFKTLKEIDRFETFVKPYNNLIIEKKAIEKTMVTMTDINSGITIEQFNKTIIKFYEDHMVPGAKNGMGRLVSVGQNIPFDHGFLNYALHLQKRDISEFFMPNFIDTWPLAKATWGLTGEEKLNLGANCERIDRKLVDAHGAMNDVEATADLFRFFVKKLRAKKGEFTSKQEEKRAVGSEFFEFKCGKK